MKSIFAILIFCMGLTAYSQAIILKAPNYASNGLMTPPGTDVTNDTIFYCATNMILTFEDGLVDVINNTFLPMKVMVRRMGDDHGCFASNQFCWTICHNPNVSLSDTLTINSGDTSHAFHGWVTPDGNEGCCFMTYKFFNAEDTAQFSTVTVRYCFANVCTPDVGLVQVDHQEFLFYPNPVSDKVVFESNHEDVLYLTILSSSGENIYSKIWDGSKTLDLSLRDLPVGMYFCIVRSHNKVLGTKKLIINR